MSKELARGNLEPSGPSRDHGATPKNIKKATDPVFQLVRKT